MRAELPHYTVGDLYGFNQEKYKDFTMRLGGCAATTACEACLLLKKEFGLDRLYPHDPEAVTAAEFEAFALRMKPYLRPRLTGIDRLDIYTEGFGRYLADVGETRLRVTALPGSEPVCRAAQLVRDSIDAGLPVPVLLLYHRDPAFREYVWHWFLLNAYDTGDAGDPGDLSGLRVRAATYGEYEWLPFYDLWDTGYDKKGGLILLQLDRSI